MPALRRSSTTIQYVFNPVRSNNIRVWVAIMGFGPKNHGRGELWCVFLLLAAGGVLLATTVASAAGAGDEGPAAAVTKAEGSSGYLDPCQKKCQYMHTPWYDQCMRECVRYGFQQLGGRGPESAAAAARSGGHVNDRTCEENCERRFVFIDDWAECVDECRRHGHGVTRCYGIRKAAADARRLGGHGKTAASAIREVV